MPGSPETSTIRSAGSVKFTFWEPARGCILGRVCHGIPTAILARACSELGHIDLFHEYAGALEVAGGDDDVKIRCRR